MGILGWILFGLVVGIVAKLIMPGKDPGGFIVTIILGIVGALLGDTVRYTIASAVTLGLAQGALLARMTRSMICTQCARLSPSSAV